MTNTPRSRQPQGVPTGGQFAAETKTEPFGSLSADAAVTPSVSDLEDYVVATAEPHKWSVDAVDDLEASYGKREITDATARTIAEWWTNATYEGPIQDLAEGRPTDTTALLDQIHEIRHATSNTDDHRYLDQLATWAIRQANDRRDALPPLTLGESSPGPGSVPNGEVALGTDGRSYIRRTENGMERRFYEDGSMTVLDSRKPRGTNRTLAHTGPDPDRAFTINPDRDVPLEKITKTTKETAQALRADLKKRFPDTKFSVRMASGTAYGWLDVSWADGPTPEAMREVCDYYEGERFNGMTDSYDQVEPRKEVVDGREVLVEWGASGINTHRTFTREAQEWARGQMVPGNVHYDTVEHHGDPVRDGAYRLLARTDLSGGIPRP